MAKAITIPSWPVVVDPQQSRMVPSDKTSTLQDNKGPIGGKGVLLDFGPITFGGLDSWTADQKQSAKKLLVESAAVFSKNDLDRGKCNILKHAIKITDPQPFMER